MRYRGQVTKLRAYLRATKLSQTPRAARTHTHAHTPHKSIKAYHLSVINRPLVSFSFRRRRMSVTICRWASPAAPRPPAVREGRPAARPSPVCSCAADDAAVGSWQSMVMGQSVLVVLTVPSSSSTTTTVSGTTRISTSSGPSSTSSSALASLTEHERVKFSATLRGPTVEPDVSPVRTVAKSVPFGTMASAPAMRGMGSEGLH
mmetsp:Transcript_3180/g.8027  ORF Transcript_3180/g.8027 Transcript_3180/m.8027 type:complete len:204 (-) Transcript_3180:1779-2390(-)